MNVRLTKEQKIKILDSQDIFYIMQQVLMRENKIGRDKEHFWILGLAANNRLLFIELIGLGSVNQAIIKPMEVFSFALQKRAVTMILAHNHPSGELEPSPQDKDITDRLLQNSLFLNVPIIDHIILSETAYYSFNDTGLLQRLRLNTKYKLPYMEEEERLRKEGEKNKAVEMAKALKKKGIDIKVDHGGIRFNTKRDRKILTRQHPQPIPLMESAFAGAFYLPFTFSMKVFASTI